MLYRILTLFVCTMLLMSSSIHAEDNTRLMVAWLENNSVMVWHTGDAAPTPYTAADNIVGNTRQLLISSDGQYVAVNVVSPGSLWLATPTDANLIEFVPNQAIHTPDDPKYLRIGTLQRGMVNTFYFNTYDQPSHYSFQHDDLWMADTAARTFKQLLPSQQGGYFSVSPDGQHIVIIQSGEYGKKDGTISLVDKAGQNRLDILSFPAVSTASDYNFYPQPNWEPDSSGLTIAIPDKDLIYHDDSALTTLWHFGVDGSHTQLGTVQASFFGLPQWSPSGRNLVYLRHKGDITTNLFELVDGFDIYATGSAGSLGIAQWLPNNDQDQFIYPQGEPGDYWLGTPTQIAMPLSKNMYNPRFVDSTTYVYTTTAGDAFELRYAKLGETESTLIATVHSAVPIFDALLTP